MRAMGIGTAGCMLAWLAWGSTGGAFAPDKPDDRPGASSGAGAAKEFEVLSKLEGKWKIDEEYPPNSDLPKGAQGKGEATLRLELGKKYLLGEYSSKCKEMGTDVDALAVFTYDEQAAVYRHWWFDNYGNSYEEFLGKYDSKANALVFTREYTPPGATDKVTDRYTYTFKDEDTVVFKMEFSSGPGTFDLVLTTTYSRKGKKPAAEEEVPSATTPTKAKRMMGG